MHTAEARQESPGTQEFKFDVFISYRHSDLDSAVAGYLQKALERYKIPREIQKRHGKKAISRVFRDEEELGAASDLFGEIEQNLKQSEFLVVICSPRLLESKWCMREIETFIKYRGRENVLPVLIEGEPDTAFPAILTEDGEPLAADFRGRSKREVLHHAKERMPRLAAPLLYCSYDELYQRRRVYRMHRILALVSAAAAVSLMFGAVTVMQNREIQSNYQAKLENQFRYLAQTSQELLDSGDRDSALLVALEALPESSEDTSRPYVAEARIALEEALYTYAQDHYYRFRPVKMLEQAGQPGSIADSSEEENVILTTGIRTYAWDTDDTCIQIWDAESCELLCTWDGEGQTIRDAKLAGGHSVLVLTDTGVCCFDYRDGQSLWQWDYPACDSSVCSYGTDLIWAYDPASGLILCANKTVRLHYGYSGDSSVGVTVPSHMFYLLDAADGQSRPWAPADLFALLQGEDYPNIYLEKTALALSPGGKSVCLVFRNGLGDEDRTLAVLPAGGDSFTFTRQYATRGMLDNAVERALFVDEDNLLILHTLDGTAGLGSTGSTVRWELQCLETGTGTVRMSYQDSCKSLLNQTSIQVCPTADGPAILSVTYDNMAVNLDWDTWELYGRIEDRSTIVLNHIRSAKGAVMATADGYVFGTSPIADLVFAPIYSAYHYYIDLPAINQTLWLNERVFFFTDAGIYCYAPVTDESCAAMEAVPEYSFFTGDSKYLLSACQNGQMYLYDTEDFSVLWQDEYLTGYGGQTAALLDDQWCAYLAGDGTTVKFHSLLGDAQLQVTLDDPHPAFVDNGNWWLRASGGGNVLVWNSYSLSLGFSESEDVLDETALWLVNAGQGKVTARWTFRELYSQFPDPFDPSRSDLSISDSPIAAADGRYVLIPCQVRGHLVGDESWGESLEASMLTVWDLETGGPVPLSDRIMQGMAQELALGTYFERDGWVSPTEPAAVFYNEKDHLLQIANLTTGEVLHELAVDGVGSQEVSFTPDGDHLIFQDSLLRLNVYNWKEGRYTMKEVSPEKGHLRFAFFQGGQTLSATTSNAGVTSSTALYQRVEPGFYKLEASVSLCSDCDGRTVVIDDNAAPRLYHAYTLDELIAQAREILGGRELTEAERKIYLID